MSNLASDFCPLLGVLCKFSDGDSILTFAINTKTIFLHEFVTLEAVLISMLSVAGSESVLLIVLGIPLMLVMEKTGLKNRLP